VPSPVVAPESGTPARVNAASVHSIADRWPALLAVAALATAFVVLYAPVVTRLVANWSADENYSHGFIVAPLAVYFAWARREALAAAPRRPTALGLVLILGSLAVLVAGLRGAELFLTRVSMVGVLAGVVLFVLGPAPLRVLAFPLAFLLLMIPLPAIVFNRITLPLQLFASQVGEQVLDAAGVPVLREGNIVLLPYTSLEVVEACSGIRSIMSLITLGVVFVQFTTLSRARRILLVLSTIPLAVLANGLRVAATGLAAHRWGSEFAEGTFHTAAGWAMFVLTFAALLGLARLLESDRVTVARFRRRSEPAC